MRLELEARPLTLAEEETLGPVALIDVRRDLLDVCCELVVTLVLAELEPTPPPTTHTAS